MFGPSGTPVDKRGSVDLGKVDLANATMDIKPTSPLVRDLCFNTHRMWMK